MTGREAKVHTQHYSREVALCDGPKLEEAIGIGLLVMKIQ